MEARWRRGAARRARDGARGWGGRARRGYVGTREARRGEGETRRSSAVWSMRGACVLCVYMCVCVLDVVTDVGVVCVFCARAS